MKQDIVEKAKHYQIVQTGRTQQILLKATKRLKESGMALKKKLICSNRLKNACNNFFNNLKEQQKAQDKELLENLKLKKSS